MQRKFLRFYQHWVAESAYCCCNRYTATAAAAAAAVRAVSPESLSRMQDRQLWCVVE